MFDMHLVKKLFKIYKYIMILEYELSMYNNKENIILIFVFFL